MGRPIYPHELEDPDFAWLISNFKENHPNYGTVESSCLPIVFIEETSKEYGKNVPLPPKLLQKDPEAIG